MGIIKQLRNHKILASQALEFYEAMSVHHSDEAIEQLIEACAELYGASDESSEEGLAIEMAGMLSPGDDENTFNFKMYEDEPPYLFTRDAEGKGWIEIEPEEDCKCVGTSCEQCTPSHEKDPPA